MMVSLTSFRSEADCKNEIYLHEKKRVILRSNDPALTFALNKGLGSVTRKMAYLYKKSDSKGMDL